MQAGDVYLAADFGYKNDTPPLYTITDRTWIDVNNDQLRDQFDSDGDGTPDTDEPWLEGVTVALQVDADPGPGVSYQTIASNVSDIDGEFTFYGVPNGDYRIVIVDAASKLPTLRPTTDPARAAFFDVTVADANVDNTSFGYRRVPAVGDRVWSDADGDGIQDPNEPGIPGVTLELFEFQDANGNDVFDSGETATSLGTRVTDVNGLYLFNELEARHYYVEVLTGTPNTFDATIDLAADFTQTGDPDEVDGTPPETCVICDDRGSTLLGGARADLTRDFGYQNGALANISGNVFEDLDRDGVDDGAGEPGFGGVTMRLVVMDRGLDGICGNFDDTFVSTVATTVTAIGPPAATAGDYAFNDLPANCYRVEVTDSAGILDNYELTSGLDSIPVELMTTDVTDVDFGYVRESGSASIGDFVWLDADKDGAQDSAEPGIPGIDLELWDAGPDGTVGGGDDSLIATTRTDGIGGYVFDGLDAGAYFVRVSSIIDGNGNGQTDPGDRNVLLAGLELTNLTPPGPEDQTPLITLSEGEDYDEADFGYGPASGLAAIGDFVWADADSQGDFDAGEVGIDGVRIELMRVSDSAMFETRTGPNGFYLFPNLLPGQYTVTVDNSQPGSLPLQYQPDPTNTGSTGGVPNVTYNITVAANQAILSADFGFPPVPGQTGSIGDFVWLDEDGDGMLDPDEEGIANVTLNLITAGPNGIFEGGGGDDQVLATTTASDGSYSFTGLLFNDYQVIVTDVGGVLAGLNRSSPPVSNIGAMSDDTVRIGGGQPNDYPDADFGYAPSSSLGSIGNLVFLDVPEVVGPTLVYNGIFEPANGDSGIEDVELALWLDRNANGVIDNDGTDNLLRRTRTDSIGVYEFTGLPPENYIVQLTDLNFVSGGALEGLARTVQGAVDTDNQSQCVDPSPVECAPKAVPLVGTGQIPFVDFGFRGDQATPLFNISGTAFEDVDNDSLYEPAAPDDEPEVPSAVITLYRDANANGVIDPSDPILSQFVTGADGFFQFTGLPEDDYLIESNVGATTVSGYDQTTQQSDSGCPSPAPRTTNPPDANDCFPQSGVQWVILAGADSTGNDFGYYDGGVVTTPITLAWFRADRLGSEIQVRWTTETETSNVGFQLFAEGFDGVLRPFGTSGAGEALFSNGFESALLSKNQVVGRTETLIPGASTDRVLPQSYSVADRDDGVARLYLADVDVEGNRTLHGPFDVGSEYGRNQFPLEQPNWASIREESAANQAGRHAGLSNLLAARVHVTRSGIQRISYEALEAAGFGLRNTPVEQLRLERNGVAVPFFASNGRGAMRQGDALEFYGRAADTLYTGTNVYILRRVSASEGSPRATIDATIPGLPVDAWHEAQADVEPVEPLRYSFAAFDGDPWYLDSLREGGTLSYTIVADEARSGTAAFTGELWGITDFPGIDDHHVQVSVNGQSLLPADRRYDGRLVIPISGTLGAGAWFGGANTIEVASFRQAGVPFSVVYSNEFELTYPRNLVARDGSLDFVARGVSAGDAFEVGGLSGPDIVVYGIDGDRLIRYEGVQSENTPTGVAITVPATTPGQHYVVADATGIVTPIVEPLREAASLLPTRLDYLMVAHPDFVEGLAPLVQHHEADGFDVAVVDLQQAYDRYTGGNIDPIAIEALIDEAYLRGARYVLLVGGDSYDYRDYLGIGAVSFLPTTYRRTSDLVAFAPTDLPFADVDGDDLPDVALGRFPARSGDELDALITKTLQYSTKSYNNTALFASDKRQASDSYSFQSDSLRLEQALPPIWNVTTASLDDAIEAQAGNEQAASAAVRAQIADAINGGVALTSYFGHSGPTSWSLSGVFSYQDAAALTNAGMPTVVTQWGCWNTYFVAPEADTLAHRFLLSGESGAAAVLGASTLTEAYSDRALGLQLLPLATQPGQRLGDAMMQAKRELADQFDIVRDVIFGFTLLGDPALKVVN